MNQIQGQYKSNLTISSTRLALLENLIKKINLILKGKREVMYSDIINLIAKENYRGKLYNEIMLWCNYNIRQGKYYATI